MSAIVDKRKRFLDLHFLGQSAILEVGSNGNQILSVNGTIRRKSAFFDSIDPKRKRRCDAGRLVLALPEAKEPQIRQRDWTSNRGLNVPTPRGISRCCRKRYLRSQQ